MVPVKIPLKAIPQFAAMRNRLIELEHFRRLAGRKIPHLQNTVRVAEYTVQKRDEQIACLKQLVSGMQHQQKNDANVTSAKLAVSQTSIFQPPQPERRHSAGARSRSNSAPSVQEIQPVTDVTPILCAQKRRISILQNELVKARDVIESKDQRIKKAAAYKQGQRGVPSTSGTASHRTSVSRQSPTRSETTCRQAQRRAHAIRKTSG